MKERKLTAPQIRMLRKLSVYGAAAIASWQPSIMVLEREGYVERRRGRFVMLCHLTAKGQDALRSTGLNISEG